MVDATNHQTRSARHYLDASPLMSSLETTVSITARILGFPIALVNLFDETDQHSISAVGASPSTVIPRHDSLCETIFRTGRPAVSEDARTDSRFAHLPSVIRGDVRTYVGVPLRGRESLVVGALCVMDAQPHEVSAEAVARMEDFARIVEDQLELMRRLRAQRLEPGVAKAELADAIATGQIVPWYQPMVDLTTGIVTGFEALARWQHPTAGVLDPNSFVPFAEDSDLIIELDRCVMRQALTDLHRWTRTVPDLRVGINISSREFDHDDWLAPIEAMLAETGTWAGSVDLELTETARLGDRHFDGAFVKALQAMGFRVWMDDFGTGWSSLEYLLRLPVDGIKIDRVMAVALGTPVGNAITRAVAGLADDLGLDITIEGVGTAEQAQLARRLGCRTAQGYLWSRPVPAAAVEATWLARSSRPVRVADGS